ncbi:hypothetical protein MU516_16245 [Paracoccus sp. YLB-12]|uniref:Thioredoxin-like fold domain-containing protein n=1 Tax=Paracoccus maritimus TaxID=2933292 RepID=A0ABT2KCY7_9RHOB|nr:hypothetical protein [Paracoccus sp. YLB-12]MCT4334412.1 hypothetical protein [Paracoccus sp. YLB-12]
MITRRNAILFGTSAALLSPISAQAEMSFSPTLILQNLKKSVWLSTNRSAQRAVYVVAAPWCPFCEQLYKAQTQMAHDIDFRYVFMSFRQSGNAVVNAFFSNVEDQVGLFYSDRMARNPALGSGSADWFGNINLVAGHRMARDFRGLFVGTNAGSGSSAGFAYPTVVQKDQQGQIAAILGAWLHLDAIVQTNGDLASDSPDTSRFAEIIRSAPQLRSDRRNYFSTEADTPIFTAPMLSSAIVERLAAREGYSMSGALTFGGEEWLAAQAFTSGSAMVWAKKSDLYSR